MMPVTSADTNLALALNGSRPDHHLTAAWSQALAGSPAAQNQWQLNQGGRWQWQPDGLALKNGGGEWSSLGWQPWTPALFSALNNFVIEVTVSGQAEAAGLSFGDYKDFLAPLDANHPRRQLQLEVDLPAGSWAFRVDGQLQPRAWWDSGVRTVDDLLAGLFSFKARRVEQVVFQELAIHPFQASCQLSVIMTCYRFLQRLRVSLRNWCHQTLPAGAYELLVVNPASPDGTHEYLSAVAGSYPHVRVREVAVEPRLARNKGAMINRALALSRGQWVWLTDADCLFAPTCAAATLERLTDAAPRLFYGQRRYLSASQTNSLLAGRIDGLTEFERLCQNTAPRAVDNQPWGYTQIVHRSTLERVPYREHINHFAHSDSLFIEDCRRRRILPAQIDGLFCLHLDHPFAWYGTDMFL